MNHSRSRLVVQSFREAMKRARDLTRAAQVYVHLARIRIKRIARRWFAPPLANALLKMYLIIRRFAAVPAALAEAVDGDVVQVREHERAEDVRGQRALHGRRRRRARGGVARAR